MKLDCGGRDFIVVLGLFRGPPEFRWDSSLSRSVQFSSVPRAFGWEGRSYGPGDSAGVQRKANEKSSVL